MARPAFSRWLLENDRLRERWPCQWLNVLYFPFSETSPGKLPSISPALLRQLAGMGNNLNQIARRVNAGGGTGHDRVQIVAALMAIDAGLERLRHAVLEKGTDDDR
nr:MobC family plasmid mobilization relaxosome protein [Aeromonas caviae]